MDPDLGTGVVKITPAHDPNDYDCSVRHGLKQLVIMDDRGFINAHAGESWSGMGRFEARSRVIERLSDEGLYFGDRDHAMSLALCSRTGDVLEPMLKPQWFVRCAGDMSKRALSFAVEGPTRIIPGKNAITWQRWLENSRDWCVSRQLWWGHRVPAYRVRGMGEKDDSAWIVARSEAAALAEAQGRFPHMPDLKVDRDPDVLDTWFSSALLPLSAFGWPHDPQPSRLDVMETGSDILFFWVARMAMLCSELHPEKTSPFQDIYLHPMVRDKRGQKMSKSLGNVIDPNRVIDGCKFETLEAGIASSNLSDKEKKRSIKLLRKEFPKGIERCGADALRFALASYLQQGDAINMNINNVVASRKFCNKLWNSVKYIERYWDAAKDSDRSTDEANLASTWILSRLRALCDASNDHLENYRFAAYTQGLQRFWIEDFCDVYVEATKADPDSRYQLHVLLTCADTMMRLAHPVMPHLTEALWQRVSYMQRGEDHSGSISETTFPVSPCERDPAVETDMELLLATVHKCRSAKAALGGVISPKQLSTLVVETDGSASGVNVEKVVCMHASLLRVLCRVDVISSDISVLASRPHIMGPGVAGSVLFLGLPECSDDIKRDVCKKLEGKVAQIETSCSKALQRADKLSTKINVAAYVKNTPADVQERDRGVVEGLHADVAAGRASMDALLELRKQLL